ncbi:MAG TPA: hypothetical protein VG318_00520 [Actinomycetota bacterium]|nr:hypothetical protein [Actinomycetota bacterium]
MYRRTRMRTHLAAMMLLALAGCTRTGINAGEEGGVAFILMAVMLILTAVILWVILGREE